MHLQPRLCVDVHFHLACIHIEECDCCIIWSVHVQLHKNCQTGLHSCCAVLGSYQQCGRVPAVHTVASSGYCHLKKCTQFIVHFLVIFSFFFFIVILICTSLMAKDAEHLFPCLFATLVFLGKD